MLEAGGPQVSRLEMMLSDEEARRIRLVSRRLGGTAWEQFNI